MRNLRAKKDYRDILATLSDTNKFNRMAFEYSMAWYMLTKQLEKFVQNLDRLDDFDYPHIPRHYEEAILIYKLITKKQIEPAGYQISQQSHQRYKDFMLNYARPKANKIALQYLVTNYSNSYFFYYFFRPPRPTKLTK